MVLPKIYILKKHGFTLIEVLIVLTLLSVLAGFGLILTLDSYRRFAFGAQQELLVSLLERARAQSVSNVNQSPHGLHIDAQNSTFTLFQGDSFAERDISQDLIFAGNPVQSLEGFSDIVFSRLSGTTTPGSFILSDKPFGQANITLNYEGQINLH